MSGRKGTDGRKIRWVRLTARIFGGVIVAYVLLMVIGFSVNLITEGEADPYAEDDIPITEYAGPVFFFLSAIGLALAFKWEGLGGTVTVLSQVLFIISQFIFVGVSMDNHFIMPIILSFFMMLPGLLYLIWWRRVGQFSRSKIPEE